MAEKRGQTSYNLRDITEYNPADLANLVRYCVQELMQRRAYEMPLREPFDGAGIYALFYDGDFPLYQDPSIRSPNAVQPIYVGRARRTRTAGPSPLFNRLRQHARSIEAAGNLKIENFRCRFLVLHPLWVSTVEDLLIEYYSTLWNDAVEGFGVHDPGGQRHTGEIPMWDVLHPGRPHRAKMIERGATSRSIEDIAAIIADYTAKHSAPNVMISGEEVERASILAADSGSDESE